MITSKKDNELQVGTIGLENSNHWPAAHDEELSPPSTGDTQRRFWTRIL